jgi:hypothetical protein
MTPRIFPRLYLAADSDVSGPHDAHDVLDTFRAGSLPWEHLAAIEGTDDWQPLGDILRAFFPGLIPAPQIESRAMPTVVHVPVYTQPPQQSSLGKLFDVVGASILILAGAAMIVFGIPLMVVLIGFILVPLGIFFVIIGTVVLFKS